MKETVHPIADIAQQSTGLKAAVATMGAGGVTTAVSASPDWTTYAGLGLTCAGLLVAIVSCYIGYCNLKERKRENDRKEAERNGS